MKRKKTKLKVGMAVIVKQANDRYYDYGLPSSKQKVARAKVITSLEESEQAFGRGYIEVEFANGMRQFVPIARTSAILGPKRMGKIPTRCEGATILP